MLYDLGMHLFACVREGGSNDELKGAFQRSCAKDRVRKTDSNWSKQQKEAN
jgi:hypothetical protein